MPLGISGSRLQHVLPVHCSPRADIAASFADTAAVSVSVSTPSSGGECVPATAVSRPTYPITAQSTTKHATQPAAEPASATAEPTAEPATAAEPTDSGWHHIIDGLQLRPE